MTEETVEQRRLSRGGAWTAVGFAVALTLNEVCCVPLLPIRVIGQISFVLLLPGVFIAILLLVWAGRQGYDAVQRAAFVVGIVLLCSPLLAWAVAIAWPSVWKLFH